MLDLRSKINNLEKKLSEANEKLAKIKFSNQELTDTKTELTKTKHSKNKPQFEQSEKYFILRLIREIEKRDVVINSQKIYIEELESEITKKESFRD